MEDHCHLIFLHWRCNIPICSGTLISRVKEYANFPNLFTKLTAKAMFFEESEQTKSDFCLHR